jgi:hypothetical protein
MPLSTKEQTIAEVLRIRVGAYSQEYVWLAKRMEQAVSDAYDAGYRAAIEQCAQLAEDEGAREACAVAAEIRKLTP